MSNSLTAGQHAFFDAFGFLRLRGFFASEIDEITNAFEAVFASGDGITETQERVHGHERRFSVRNIFERNERLGHLARDPGVLGVAHALIGDDPQFQGSDGNLFYCDTYWHSDIFGSPLNIFHVKFNLYLDPVDASSGAIRVIPGSHEYRDEYSLRLRRTFRDPTQVENHWGVDAGAVPAWAIASEPGDLILWNYRTLHASFGGRERRRHISFGFREPVDENEESKAPAALG